MGLLRITSPLAGLIALLIIFEGILGLAPDIFTRHCSVFSNAANGLPSSGAARGLWNCIGSRGIRLPRPGISPHLWLHHSNRGCAYAVRRHSVCPRDS